MNLIKRLDSDNKKQHSIDEKSDNEENDNNYMNMNNTNNNILGHKTINSNNNQSTNHSNNNIKYKPTEEISTLSKNLLLDIENLHLKISEIQEKQQSNYLSIFNEFRKQSQKTSKKKSKK